MNKFIFKLFLFFIILLPNKAYSLIEVDITRGNLNPLPIAVSPLSSDDGTTYTSQVDVDDSASYINWKFVLHHEDGSQSDVPEQGFGWKIWSDCWWDNGTWGGPNSDCQEGPASLLPGFAASAAAASAAASQALS